MHNSVYNEDHIIHNLKHYLPAQAPLKDFIHHNTLHAFQKNKFHFGLKKASEIFGYKTYLCLDEYRKMFNDGKINPEILIKVIKETKGNQHLDFWCDMLLDKEFDTNIHARIGNLRSEWKNKYKINLSKETHPVLLRLIANYIDQGIGIKNLPQYGKGFLDSIKDLERNSYISLFKGKRARDFLFNTGSFTIKTLLDIIIGDEYLFEQYLFDQQFEHPGWSGMVSVLEDNPEALLDKRNISLREFIYFELLLELDLLDAKFPESWLPLALSLETKPTGLFSDIAENELFEVLAIWQEAFEWTYYNTILESIQNESVTISKQSLKAPFQALFCIDDRECSLRRYLEQYSPNCKTYATAGYFNVEFYFQPAGGKFHTKLCPAPIKPKFIIKEEKQTNKRVLELYFTKHTHSLLGGWLSQTLGFWSAINLLFNVFRPSLSPATNYSFHHMDKFSTLTIENKNKEDKVFGLQVGFTVTEMADRIEGLLKSIGLVNDFSSLIYIVGHGASSVNNTYYAGYDCGACSGRPGSVNARVAAHMANHKKVREILKTKGIIIPENTQFIGALQDTTRDEVEFFDEIILTNENKQEHEINKQTFMKALDSNAEERAKRFVTMDNQKSAKEIHKKVKLRSVSLFEPRPEYNHATNALCIVGRRELSSRLFLDRRSFLNSYNYNIDLDGKYLLNILKAIAPVCGGINLEYYFSRVDNQKLGAGSKLSHNVIGLIGIANGADGDLRTGLPLQMIEIHDPLRLLVMVEHFPEVILKTLQKNEDTYQWFMNDWIHLIAIHPQTKEIFKFKNGSFYIYTTITSRLTSVNIKERIIKQESENKFPNAIK